MLQIFNNKTCIYIKKYIGNMHVYHHKKAYSSLCFSSAKIWSFGFSPYLGGIKKREKIQSSYSHENMAIKWSFTVSNYSVMCLLIQIQVLQRQSQNFLKTYNMFTKVNSTSHKILLYMLVSNSTGHFGWHYLPKITALCTTNHTLIL